MRKLCLALLVGSLASFCVGCGGSPQEADSSHLNIDDNAEAQAAQGRVRRV